jgi:pimeloyl-ACP methyl ester carboxylesterase
MLRLIGSTLNFIFRIAPSLGGRWTWALYCRSRLSKVRENERATHQEAVVDSVTVNGNRIVTYRWGTGEHPVLLLHGWESRSSRYAGFVRALRERGMSAISFDAPGHGDSEGQATILEYFAVIRRLYDQYGRFHAIIAHSFGVPCAFYAIRQGVHTGRLAAISGPCEFSYLPETFCQQLGLSPAMLQDLRRRNEEFFAPETEIWERFSASHKPEEIPVPILVIHDKNDDVVMVGQAHKIGEAYGDQARVVITEGMGHRRILSDAAVIEVVTNFVADAGNQAGTAVAVGA